MGTPTVQQPRPRNLGSELLQTYYGQSTTAQPYYNLESYFQPKYGQLGLSNQAQNLFGYDVPGLPRAGQPGGAPGGGLTGTGVPGQPGGSNITGSGQLLIPQPGTGKGRLPFTDPYANAQTLANQPGHHPGSLELGAAAANFQRGMDIADVAQYGPDATRAFLNANPFLAGSLTNLYGRTADSPILQTLNQQAQQGLATGGQLSPQDQRAADQTSRAAFAARGLVNSNPAAAAEVLNRDAAVRARLGAAQQFASGVQGLNQQQADLVGRASQIFGTQLSDPFQAILGRPSGAGGGGQAGGYPQQIGTGARLFDPYNAYAQDIYNTNYNAQASTNIANANAQSANNAALLGLVGSLFSAGGSAIGGI